MNNSELGYEITAIAAGINTFEQVINKGQGIIEDEGLIPLYLGSNLIEEKIYTSWDQVREEVENIGLIVEKTSESPRKMFLTQLVESLRMAVLLFSGGDTSYTEKLERLVGVPAEPISDDFIAGLAEKLENRFSKTQFTKGTLKEKILAWEQGNSIDPENLETIFNQLMDKAQERTDRMVVPTDGYTMKLNPVKNVIYTARCKFQEGKMDLNVGNSFSRSALKHLVAHECFPGHSTQNIYTLKSFKNGTSPADVLLCSLNGVTGVMQEGIGDQGVELIDWIEDVNDEIQAILRRYRSAIATSASWKLNIEHASTEDMRTYLTDVGVMQEARVNGRLGMASHLFRAPFIASYFYGNEIVKRVREAASSDPAAYKKFINDLYGNMHSPESLCKSNGVTYQSYGD